MPFLLRALAKNDVFFLTWNTAAQTCCQDLLAGGSPWDTNCDKPFLAHLSELKDRYMACNSLGMESNPASCQCSYVLSYLRCDQDREAWGRDVSRAKNKSSVFSQLFQLRCLKTLKCEAKSCLMQSSHRSWSCEVWSDYSIQIPC